MQQGPESPGLEWIIGVLRRRLPLIALCFVSVALAAFVFSKQQSKKYTATASVVFNTDSLSQELVGLPANSSNLLVQQAGNLESVQVGDMAARTAKLLGRGLTTEKVSDSLKVSGLGESSTVAVAATAASPQLAADIANTYVAQFVAEQQNIDRRFFESALALVNRQLAQLPRRLRFAPSAVALQNRAQSLRFLAEVQGANVRVAQQASPPASPSSPKISRNTILGGVLGLLLGFGLALVLERLDRHRRITDPSDLQGLYGLPLLGVVPDSKTLLRASHSGACSALPPAEAEIFHLIRAHLRLNADPRTILVASAASGDGRTTIARQLAEAAARLGAHSLLIEADLRHPTLARLLDIRSDVYLPEVLRGSASIAQAIETVELRVAPGEGLAAQTLDVLATGTATPPNPGALIEGPVMEAVLDQVSATYDFIVIDTPPLAAVSDAFPLLHKVDGVVVVGRIGRSRRDVAERLHEILDGSAATLLGVIANGSRAADLAPVEEYPFAPADAEVPAPAIPSANGASSESLFSPATKA